MRNLNHRIFAIFTICLFSIGVFAQTSANERQINEVLSNINIKLEDFQENINFEVNRNTVSGSDETKIGESLQRLRGDLDGLRDNMAARRDSQSDIRQILSTAQGFNDYLLRLRLNAKSQIAWKNVRTDIDRLASFYGVTNTWNNSINQVNANYSSNSLNGTYQLDSNRSDNVSEIAADAVKDLANNRDEVKQELEEKLESPSRIAIEIRGNQVSLVSAISPQITLSADGQDRTENLSDGSQVRLRTTLRGQDLVVSKLGENDDYTVIFTSLDNGKTLKVTRRVTIPALQETVFAESYYSKSEQTARMDIYGNDNNYPNSTTENSNTGSNSQNTTTTTTQTNYPPTVRTTNRSGNFIVANGEILTGTLENNLTTKYSQNNDRFTMRVIAPNQYRGAILEGYVSGIDRSNRNPIGSAKITLNFERIRLTNGQTYDFAGFLQSITDANGNSVKVDSEGSASKSQTKETAKRAGVGAGIGAIIGGIVGGAKGAIIGAGIGAGGGAGTVAIQNSGDLELAAGSSITVQSSSPNN